MLLNIKRKMIYGFNIGMFILLISACSGNEKSIINHYYLSLTGESGNWIVQSYKLELSPNVFNVGNGTLTMKNQTKYTTNFIDIKVHAIIDNKDEVIQAKQITGFHNASSRSISYSKNDRSDQSRT